MPFGAKLLRYGSGALLALEQVIGMDKLMDRCNPQKPLEPLRSREGNAAPSAVQAIQAYL